MVIAKKLGVERATLDRYLKRWATVREAFEAETEVTGDIAVSVIRRNIQLAYEAQSKTKSPANSEDAKWYLSRVRRNEFATKQETDVSGELVIIEVVGRDPDAD